MLAAHHAISRSGHPGTQQARLAPTQRSEPGKESHISETMLRKRPQIRSERAVSGAVVENLILLALPAEEYSLFVPHLELIEFQKRETLQQPGSNIEYGYFINRGAVSRVVELEDGRSLEVGMIGKEGFLGAPSVMGIRDTHSRAIVLAPAETFRINSEQFAEILPAAPQLQSLLARSAILYNLQVAQIAVCTRFHEIEQRLARWLAISARRSGCEDLPFTQEFLAAMLGVGRPSVTLAAGALQKAGLIRYSRGFVTILDRRGLEAAACECYRVIVQLESDAAWQR
jgi:CRP-like cAMP-binding protein